MQLTACISALADQHKLIAEQLTDKCREIYEDKYPDEYNVVCFHRADAVKQIRTTCFIYVENNETTGYNRYFIYVQTRTPFGSAAHAWMDDELIYSRVDNSIPFFTLIAGVSLIKDEYLQLVTDNDFPANTYTKFIESLASAENDFRLLTGESMSFVSGEQFNWVRAL